MKSIIKKRAVLRSQRIILRLIMILVFHLIGVGQTVDADESSGVVVPDQAMEQIVRRILIWSFKPRNKSKVVYLAEEGLQRSWLPAINNVEFRFLANEEIQQKGLQVHFFTKPQRSANNYNIGFAFGDPSCHYWGKNWHFRISKEKVRLWQNGGVRGGCGRSS
ncbi:MAG: hypothetical protein ABIU09_03170 [Pyrinomonadaceae bacterium]